MALLSIKDLHVTYFNNEIKVYAIDGVDLEVKENRALGIIGESGSGKSTLIHAILRLLSPKIAEVTGQVVFDRKELLSLSLDEFSKLRWKEISVVFQKSMNALSPVHRVGTFLTDVYKVHEPDEEKQVIQEKLENLLKLVNLPPKVLKMYPHELSGGMMQRISIALSLMFNPKLIVLDEATTALDVVTQTQILKEIIDIEKKLGVTRIMVTHDISVVSSSCDDVAILYAGNLMESGPVLEVLVEPLHPYTRCLIESFPDNDPDKNKELVSIKGSLPDLRIKAEGCIFAPRCPMAIQICHERKPIMKSYGDNRKAACHRIGGEDVGH